MAAVLNWVMKDDVVLQLYGVLFTSQLGKGGMGFRTKLGKLTGSLRLRKEKKTRGNGIFNKVWQLSNPRDDVCIVNALALDLSSLLKMPTIDGSRVVPTMHKCLMSCLLLQSIFSEFHIVSCLHLLPLF